MPLQPPFLTNMRQTQQQLETHLWGAANILRGKTAGQDDRLTVDLAAQIKTDFAPETAALQAGRVMLQQLALHTASGASFAFETTLAGRAYLRQIRQWQALGYRVKLIYLLLTDPEEAIARVAQWVRQGGHHIPADVIRRRFAAGRQNFEPLYVPCVDSWALYDNSGAAPVLLQWGEKP